MKPNDELMPWQRAGGFPQQDWIEGWRRMRKVLWDVEQEYDRFMDGPIEVSRAWLDRHTELGQKLKVARAREEAYRYGDGEVVGKYIYQDQAEEERRRSGGQPR